MLESWLVPLTLAAAVGCGVIGGVFFAFSTFVLQALGRLPAAQGISAMQSINVAAVRPAFMTMLFGTAAVCLALAVHGVVNWGEEDAVLLVAGSGLYLVGNIVVTIGGNVPLNDSLAALDPDGADVAMHWDSYLRRWSWWNHVRTATATAASAVFAVALVL